MSHSPNHVDTGPTTAFYQGLAAGINQERERILKVLNSYAEHMDLCEQGCYPEDCSAPMFEVAIQEILKSDLQENVNNNGQKGV